LAHFGGARTVIVKINPRDVVSIPTDYDNSKGRACRYEVIGEIGAQVTDQEDAFTSPVQNNASNNIAPPNKVTAPVNYSNIPNLVAQNITVSKYSWPKV
jgi:hypothetical protein